MLTHRKVRGHKRQTIDPDMGHWFYEYNALGELIEQKDAKNQITKFFYDKLGRLKERQESEGSQTRISTWVYDSAANGIGKLAKETSPNGFERTYEYDELSRPEVTDTVISGTSFRIRVSYDSASRLDVTTYPGGFKTRNLYNSSGYLYQVENGNTGKVYWTANDANADGNVSNETLGNGRVTARGYNLASGRLESIQTGAGSLQDLLYDFDALGNLESRQDQAQGLTETFGYDDLNRLTQIDTLTDGIPLTKTVGYDNLGNIIDKSDVGAYSYASARPHAATSAGANIYSYDANGNLARRAQVRRLRCSGSPDTHRSMGDVELAEAVWWRQSMHR